MVTLIPVKKFSISLFQKMHKNSYAFFTASSSSLLFLLQGPFRTNKILFFCHIGHKVYMDCKVRDPRDGNMNVGCFATSGQSYKYFMLMNYDS